MLIVLSGLPGTGKTTIGKAFAQSRAAAFVRIDEMEHVLRRTEYLGPNVGTAAYAVGHAIAYSNLQLGNWVVADSVNPVPESREGWRDVAKKAGRAHLDIEVICSDENEHRHRVETRQVGIEGFARPTWSDVQTHAYVPWTGPRLVIDTALTSPSQAVELIETELAKTVTERGAANS